MALVDGSLKDILGHGLDNREGEVWFIPHEPGVRASGAPGMIAPTEPVKATMASDGSWVADLANTATFLNDMWYRLQIRWLSSTQGAALIDFPDWKIRVTGDGPISEMIEFGGGPGGGNGGGGVNPNIWWVSADEPPPSRKFTWLIADPDDPDRENPGISGTTIGDVRVWR